VVRRLDMDKTQGIEQLFASGMSRRQIARTLDINRKSVDRHLAALEPKGASSQEAPIGQAPTGSKVSKGAKALTGSSDPNSGPSGFPVDLVKSEFWKPPNARQRTLPGNSRTYHTVAGS